MESVKSWASSAWEAIKSKPMVFVYGAVVGFAVALLF